MANWFLGAMQKSILTHLALRHGRVRRRACVRNRVARHVHLSLQEHTDRLFDSAKIMNMAIPFSKEEINEAQRAAVRENNLPSAYIRPMVFYGSEAMGLRQRFDRACDCRGVVVGRVHG